MNNQTPALSSIPAMPEATAQQQFTTHYLPLEQVTRPNLTTAETAHYLNRRPQTLRGWACLENGPLRPRRIGGLLAWSTAEVKALAGVSQ
jgi:hypothetical protein